MNQTNITIRHPAAAIFHLLKTEGSEQGWEKSVLIGEATQLWAGDMDQYSSDQIDHQLEHTEIALDDLMDQGMVKAVGRKKHNLVALVSISNK